MCVIFSKGVMGMFKQMKSIITAAALVLMTGLTGFSGSAIASTPDGEPPANEGVCDPLQGGTGGLYGLCVAYCEAQDMDTVNKEPPSTKILANYRKKMRAGDPDMPCVNPTCPCWSDVELASISGAACSRGTNTIIIIGIDAETHEAFADTGRNRCSYVDLNTVPDEVNTQSTAPTPTNPDQAAICFSQVEAACDAQSL